MNNKYSASMVEAVRNVDGRFYITTDEQIIDVVEYISGVLMAGGSVQSLGIIPGMVNGMNTFIMTLFVLDHNNCDQSLKSNI